MNMAGVNATRDRVADAIEAAFKTRVAESAEMSFEDTGVTAPKRDLWLLYADAAIKAMSPEPVDDGWEYATTTGPRKAWYEAGPPEGFGWEPDYSRGRPSEAWERFEYHEEMYWKRRKPQTPSAEGG